MSEIYLYGYDLFKGMIQKLSPLILGKKIDGIWHTSIFAFDREWYFGNVGIDNCIPKGTILGEPNEIIFLGKTELSQDEFLKIISKLSETDFKRGSYNYLSKNCNNFTNEISLLLFDKPIQSCFIDSTKQILNSPLGSFLEPLLTDSHDPNFDFDTSNRYFKRELETNGGDVSVTLPNKIIYFKPSLHENDLNKCLEEYKNLCEKDSVNFYLFNEIINFTKNCDFEVSFDSSHANLLFQLFQIKDMKNDTRTLFLKLIQILSLNEKIAELIINSVFFWSDYFMEIKNFNTIELKYLAIQQISNLLVNKSIDEKFLEKYQDLIFEEFSTYCFVDVLNNEESQILHEASISLFYNLVSAHQLENMVNERNKRKFGYKLFENLIKFKSKPKTIHQILLLLKKCLVN